MPQTAESEALVKKLVSYDEWQMYRSDVLLGDTCHPPAQCTIALSELTCVHPDLPKTLTALITHMNRTARCCGADKHQVSASTAMLLHGLISAMSDRGEQVHYLLVQNIIEQVNNPEDVLLIGMQANVCSEQVGNEIVPFVLSTTWGNTLHKKKDLNDVYPGWEIRWKVGNEIGLGLEELNEHIFKQPILKVPAIDTTLPELG